MAIYEGIDRSYISRNEVPLDKRTLYQTKADFLNADENKYVETTNPATGTTIIDTTRFIGQKVVIQADPENDGEPQEYWFRDGIKNVDLVKYDSYEWEDLEPGSGGGGGSGDVNFATLLKITSELPKEIGVIEGVVERNFEASDKPIVPFRTLVVDNKGTLGIVVGSSDGPNGLFYNIRIVSTSGGNTIPTPIPIDFGGTGAITAAGARNNLGVSVAPSGIYTGNVGNDIRSRMKVIRWIVTYHNQFLFINPAQYLEGEIVWVVVRGDSGPWNGITIVSYINASNFNNIAIGDCYSSYVGQAYAIMLMKGSTHLEYVARIQVYTNVGF